MLWRELNRVEHIFSVGDRCGWPDLCRLKFALSRHPADFTFKFIDCVQTLGIDDDPEAFDQLHTDSILDEANGELNELRLGLGILVRRSNNWEVVFSQEGLDDELLVASVALIRDMAGVASNRNIFDLADCRVNLSGHRELEHYLRLVSNIDGMLRQQFERDLGELLHCSEGRRIAHLQRASQRRECHSLINLSNLFITARFNLDFKRFCCFFIIGLLELPDQDCGDLVILNVPLTSILNGEPVLTYTHF